MFAVKFLICVLVNAFSPLGRFHITFMESDNYSDRNGVK
jgi:hypothetical protein